MLLAVIAVAAGVVAGILAGRLDRHSSRHSEAAPVAGSRRQAIDRPLGALRRWAVMDTGLLVVGLLAVVSCRLWPSAGGAAAISVTGDALLAILAGRCWRHPGAILIAAGLGANLVVTAVDGGMPVRAALPLAGRGLHHQLTTGDHLRGLADLVHVPLVGTLASAGDLTLCAGAAVAAFWGMWRIGNPEAAGARPRQSKVIDPL